ncbi:MAG: OPT family oligopeptide transporter [Bryobacteraceae bacterium]
MKDDKPFRPYVPANKQMEEFTWTALILGVAMSVILGAANAYLGLRAGQTIAATYPAAVISMAVLRLCRGTILSENIARTAGSIGESIAAGAVFTLPAFIIAGSWTSFGIGDAYLKSTALMLIGGVLGVLFVSLVRRTMVEDRELPYPESVAAAEIHKAGQSGGTAARHLFWSMGLGGLIYALGELRLFAKESHLLVALGEAGRSVVRLGAGGSARTVPAGAVSTFYAPEVSPAYVGVGYIIGPKLASLNFAGGVVSWGLLVPLLLYFMGPEIQKTLPPGSGNDAWEAQAVSVWRFIVRPIAVGTMMIGTAFTLFRMRKSLAAGLGRAFSELRHGAPPLESIDRNERYMSSKTVFGLIAVAFVAMAALYIGISGLTLGGIVAAVVMLLVGFFFATISGYLVGIIGSSNNPISGLTLSTLIIAALLMISLGISGPGGVVVVLGVAAVVCVSSAVAGELLQDFKVGYILGGTPRTIQIVELVAVVISSLLMYFPLMVLHQGNINDGGTGFGDPKLSAPQAGLMALLAQGIVGGEMAWPLVGVGVLLGAAMIMFQVRSVMLVAVGMYIPLQTTFAIFIGGMIRWFTDTLAERKGLNEAQRIRVENVGILAASGLIAGEALMGLVKATFSFAKKQVPALLDQPSYLTGLAVLALIALVLIRLPLSNAGRADEPAPPSAMM